MSTQNFQGQIAVITGASSGIGAATARRLAKEGLQTVLVARRRERLNALAEEILNAGGQAVVIPADLSCVEDRLGLHRQVMERFGGADVLFNNAGFGWYGYYEKMSWQVEREIIEVNAVAAAHLTRLFLPVMRAQGRGHILFMGSMTAILPVQGSVVYGASKGYIDAFASALHRELRGSGVDVSIIRAGPIHTEFFAANNALEGAMHLPGEKYAIPPEKVAEAVWSLLRRPRRLAHVPGSIRWVPLLEWSFGWLIDRIGPALLRRGR